MTIQLIDHFSETNPSWIASDATPGSKAKVEDWSCVGGHPVNRQAMPGYRYGLTTAIKPMLVVKPCACPGGVIQPPAEYTYGIRDSDGLWHVNERAKFTGFVDKKGVARGGIKAGCGAGKKLYNHKSALISGQRYELPSNGKTVFTSLGRRGPGRVFKGLSRDVTVVGADVMAPGATNKRVLPAVEDHATTPLSPFTSFVEGLRSKLSTTLSAVLPSSFTSFAAGRHHHNHRHDHHDHHEHSFRSSAFPGPEVATPAEAMSDPGQVDPSTAVNGDPASSQDDLLNEQNKPPLTKEGERMESIQAAREEANQETVDSMGWQQRAEVGKSGGELSSIRGELADARGRITGEDSEENKAAKEEADRLAAEEAEAQAQWDTAMSSFSTEPGQEAYSADFGCVAGPDTRGEGPGTRAGGPFWSTVVGETDCPCDDENAMIANRVQKPKMDILLAPSTVETFRQILKLDFPMEKIPGGLIGVTEFLDDKRFAGRLQKYFIPRATDGRWIFHGFRASDKEIEAGMEQGIPPPPDEGDNVDLVGSWKGGGLDAKTGLHKGLMIQGVDAQVKGIMEFQDGFF